MIAVLGIPLLAGLMMVSAIPSAFAATTHPTIVAAQGSYTVATGPYSISIPAGDYEWKCLCIIPGLNYAYVPPPAAGCQAMGTPNPQIISTNPPWAIYAVSGQILSSAGLFLFSNFYFGSVTVTYDVIWYC